MTAKKNVSFEESVARLEIIVKALENSDTPLDEALKLFEEGVTLSKDCNTILQKAEKRVVELVKKGENIEEREFITPAKNAE